MNTWHASFPCSPPAQKLLAGKIKIFSVTAFTFLMHSASLTMGISASRTRRGIGPAMKYRDTLFCSSNIQISCHIDSFFRKEIYIILHIHSYVHVRKIYLLPYIHNQ